MRPVADLAVPVMRLDRKADGARADLGHPRRRHDLAADRGRRDVPDVDSGPHHHPAGGEMGLDRLTRGDLHRKDHERRAIDVRHALDMAADGQRARDEYFVAAGHADAKLFQRFGQIGLPFQNSNLPPFARARKARTAGGQNAVRLCQGAREIRGLAARICNG